MSKAIGSSKRVLIADDHELVLAGIAGLLTEGFELVGRVTDGRALVEESERLRPEFVIVDISMPVINGIEATRRINALSPETKVIIVTQHNDRQYLRSAFAAGACAFVLKQSAASELLTALKEVEQGRYYVSPMLIPSGEAWRFNPKVNPGDLFGAQLTPRQREVIQLVAEGNSAKQIAHLLNISVKTVEFHKASLMQQLGLRSTAELVRYAVETGMARG